MTEKITTLEQYYKKFPYPVELLQSQKMARERNKTYLEELNSRDPWLAQNLYPNTYGEMKKAREEIARSPDEKTKVDETARLKSEAEIRETSEQLRKAKENYVEKGYKAVTSRLGAIANAIGFNSQTAEEMYPSPYNKQ